MCVMMRKASRGVAVLVGWLSAVSLSRLLVQAPEHPSTPLMPSPSSALLPLWEAQ
jgi:hypothetical protein